MSHHKTGVRYVSNDDVRVALFTSRTDAETFAEMWESKTDTPTTVFTSQEVVA